MEIFELERGDVTVFVPIAGETRPIGCTGMATIPGAELAVTACSGPW